MTSHKVLILTTPDCGSCRTVEKMLDEKMKIKVEQIEKKQETMEDQLEEKIEKTED